MAHSAVHRLTSLVLLLAVTSSAKDQSRWSRQISSYTSDISDWVPLPGPVEREDPLPQIKRQAVAEPRILTEPFPGLARPSGFSSDVFPSRNYYNNALNRQLYLQSVPSVPSAPQNYLTDQGFGQNIRFGLSQPNFPLNQAFVSPQFGYDGIPSVSQSVPQIPQIKQSVPLAKPSLPQMKTKSQQIPLNPIKFEYTKTTPQVPAIPVKSFSVQPQKIKPEAPKFIDGYRVENSSNDFTYNQKKKPQSLQKIKFDYEKPASRPEIPQSMTKPQSKVEREEVQLLYVPVESLNRGQFNFRSPLTSSQIFNSDLYSQGVPAHKNSMSELHRPIIKSVDNNNPQIQNYFSEFNSQYNSQLHSQQQKEIDQVPKFSTLSSPFPTHPPTTPKPKKLKPHQPPLAIFLTEEASKNNQIKVGDVLASLKTANSVAVLDSVNPLNAPKVFIGPSSLQPPERYVKFELPYLSNIDNSDKKLRQLPFFVAPLSYNTPQGFAKIPFPSPHVGSVVINAQIRETTTPGPSTENVKPNYYTGSYNREQKPVTQKPTFSYYSTTAPKTNLPDNYQSNYYQFEPQTVSTIKPLKEPETVPPGRAGNYFLSDTGTQYNPGYETSHYNPTHYEEAPQYNYQSLPEPVKTYPVQQRVETTTTPRTTTTTTTRPPSTYPSQLLETHNPYSINQAFHFSTPLDYRSYMDEYKEPVATPVATAAPSTTQQPVNTSPTPKIAEVVTEKPRYQQQSSPIYQSYTPEVHYESEIQNQRYPIYSSNDFTYTTKTQPQPAEITNPVQQIQPVQEVKPIQQVAPVQQVKPYQQVQHSSSEYNIPPTNPSYTEFIAQSQETQAPVQNDTPHEDTYSNLAPIADVQNPSNYEYNQFEPNIQSNEQVSSTTTTTSTTTKRPVRGRGRPRYTTTPRSDSGEYATKTVTRRPLRERRPAPTRPRYEPNKITTENPTRKPYDYSEEITTKSARTRNRGRVTYKPSDDNYDRRKSHNSKEQDLAYQRDVLHQNYPVTLMERTSTVDIEAITEPIFKQSAKDGESADNLDTENAYTYERATISQQHPISQQQQQESDEDIPVFPSRSTISHGSSYVPRLSTRNEEYVYHSRSSLAPAEPTAHEEPLTEKEEDYLKPTTPIQREISEPVEFTTQPTLTNEQKEEIYTENEEYSNKEDENTTTIPEAEVTKAESQEIEEEENVVQTTPSYNRVRVRPGVIKQYHQASSTESSRIKSDKRRPVTYRPAFDRRRTTMRIDEIQQDLKTKQVHGHPEHDEYRHPVYKPDTTTESTSTQEITTKRGAFRRRRPSYSYTTTSTEGSQRKYEVKNRFRGRRPTTERPTEKTEIPVESTTTNRPIYSRYSHRPRLSERYNKKPEPEEPEDQDSNFSINRPTYAAPDADQWSPKIAIDSFKPYNPNTIADEDKLSTTERRSDRVEMDIITARNEYEDILISVTPATNSRNNKKIPDIPPTLEALVEQSKVTKSDSSDQMSTFESMLEEVMKSLEEQDEDEYSSNVMKHKGGEIGEIPPERIISSGETYNTTATAQEESTTLVSDVEDHSNDKEEETEQKTHRRGFWKKVKVRPVATETIEAAESQYYPNTVNKLGQPLNPSKLMHDKSTTEKKVSVTTYKPTFQFIKDIFSSDDITAADVLPTVEISKITTPVESEDIYEDKQTTAMENEIQTEKTTVGPGDLDLGTGSPDPTINDVYTTTTEATTAKPEKSSFSFMDYLFGTGEEDTKAETEAQIEITTELAKVKIPTTENTFIPEEITEVDDSTVLADIKKINATEAPKTVTTTELPRQETTQSTFMDLANVLSTSMSTEISHETEICFRGKCIKTFKEMSKK